MSLPSDIIISFFFNYFDAKRQYRKPIRSFFMSINLYPALFATSGTASVNMVINWAILVGCIKSVAVAPCCTTRNTIYRLGAYPWTCNSAITRLYLSIVKSGMKEMDERDMSLHLWLFSASRSSTTAAFCSCQDCLVFFKQEIQPFPPTLRMCECDCIFKFNNGKWGLLYWYSVVRSLNRIRSVSILIWTRWILSSISSVTRAPIFNREYHRSPRLRLLIYFSSRLSTLENSKCLCVDVERVWVSDDDGWWVIGRRRAMDGFDVR